MAKYTWDEQRYQRYLKEVYLSTQNSPMWLLKIPPLNNKSYAFIELSTVLTLSH
ncbi:hypothetical protein [Desulforamulus reducens]|uniref:hypothetical protein n=1 Tax=Desulforamulus reducens TaxID=59610 RepID=UPI0012EA4BEC|nr:hypothetical protein [Desulforamulus reducens]